jgi:hypothetical protein
LARDFKELQKHWYTKLRDEGFEDIEDDQGRPKEWDFNFFRNRFDPIKYQATLQYYAWARFVLTTFKFRNELERMIWELHCEGLSERKIAIRIKKYKKSWIHVIIAGIAHEIKNGSD